MKKKFLVIGLTLTMLLSTTGSAFAAEREVCTKTALSAVMHVLETLLGHGQPGDDGTGSEEGQQPEHGGNISLQGDQINTKEKQVVTLVNQARRDNGLLPLQADSQLNRLARKKAEDMAKNNYFSHTSPTYGSAFDMMQAAGIVYRTAGENIAKGQKTAETVMQGWMNSQGHRANILNRNYSRVGVGYAVSSTGTPYWVQIFAG